MFLWSISLTAVHILHTKHRFNTLTSRNIAITIIASVFTPAVNDERTFLTVVPLPEEPALEPEEPALALEEPEAPEAPEAPEELDLLECFDSIRTDPEDDLDPDDDPDEVEAAADDPELDAAAADDDPEAATTALPLPIGRVEGKAITKRRANVPTMMLKISYAIMT